LVHEAYLRLSKQDELRTFNRNHFFAISALLMRQILIDYARKRNAAKRDGGQRVTLDSKLPLANEKELDFEALDQALRRLGELDARQAQIVELRFFGGLSIEEAAEVLGISVATVKRDWLTARVWLHKELAKDHQETKSARAAQ
jgi:RNA polymerase sigma-70 factor (ECF subfamily)